MDEKKKAFRQERIVAAIIIAFAVAAFFLTMPMPGNAPIFPRIASTIMFLLGTLLLVTSILNERKGKDPETEALEVQKFQSPAVIFMLTVLYVLGFRYIGFYVTTFAVVAAEMIFMGIRSFKTIAIVEVILLAFLYWLFTVQLGVMMPHGLLF